MKTLVVGARGLIGSHVISELKLRKMPCIAWSSSDGQSLDPETGLLHKHATIPDDTSTLIYLAQSPFYKTPEGHIEHLFNVNFVTPLQLAIMAKNRGVKRFIYASSGSVYSPKWEALKESDFVRRDSWYVLSKLHAEEALSLMRNDLNSTVIRPFAVFGPGQKNMLISNLAQTIESGKTIQLNPREGTTDEGLVLSPIYVSDAAKIILNLISHNDLPVLNICGQDPVSLKQLCLLISELVHRKVSFETTQNFRTGNLVGDCSQMSKLVDFQMTRLSEGLVQTLRS